MNYRKETELGPDAIQKWCEGRVGCIYQMYGVRIGYKTQSGMSEDAEGMECSSDS